MLLIGNESFGYWSGWKYLVTVFMHDSQASRAQPMLPVLMGTTLFVNIEEVYVTDYHFRLSIIFGVFLGDGVKPQTTIYMHIRIYGICQYF